MISPNRRRSNRRFRTPLPPALSAVAALTAFALAAQAQLVANPRFGDPTRGTKIFARCARCHSLQPGRNLTGPTLDGLFGRKAGSVPGFKYSLALQRAGFVWSDDTLSEYLSGATRLRKLGRQPYHHIKDPTALGDLLAYLQATTRR